MMKFLIPFIIAVLSATGCRRSGDGHNIRPVITVSIPPQEWMLRQIAGDDIEINTLISPGADPESYEPSMQAMSKLEESKAYAMIGTLPFEVKLNESIHASYPRLNIINAADSLVLIDDCHHHAAEEEHSHESHHHDSDPHVWASPRNLKIIADRLLYAALSVCPEKADIYQLNHLRLVARIDSLQSLFNRCLSPLRDKYVVIWHPSLTYPAHDYGFHQLNIQQGHKEPSPKRMADIIDSVKEKGAVAFVIEAQHSPRMSLALNEDMRLKTLVVDLMNPDIITTLTNLAYGLGNASQ